MSEFLSFEGFTLGSILASIIGGTILIILSKLRKATTIAISKIRSRFLPNVPLDGVTEFGAFLQLEQSKSLLARYTVLLFLGLFVAFYLQSSGGVTFEELYNLRAPEFWVHRFLWLALFFFAGSLNRLFRNYGEAAEEVRQRFASERI